MSFFHANPWTKKAPFSQKAPSRRFTCTKDGFWVRHTLDNPFLHRNFVKKSKKCSSNIFNKNPCFIDFRYFSFCHFPLFFLFSVFFDILKPNICPYGDASTMAHNIYICMYIHVYVYIYICCEVIIWAKFGQFRCYYLGQVGVIIWAKLFLAYKNSGFKRFLHTQLSFSVSFCAQLPGSYLKIAFFKKWVQKLGFFKFLCFKLIFGQLSFLGLLKHYKNRGFSRFLCFLFLKEKKRQEK